MTMENYPALQQFLIPSVRPTGKILGDGSYGQVLEAKIPGAFCAVKKMHDVFEREVRGWVDRGMVEENRQKFVRECELTSRLRHPHIVQFFGVCILPGSSTPALVTELLLTDMHTMFLPVTERACKPNIPLGLKLSILYDVAQGLLYLHSQSPPIIHRDLTARNVLLNAAMTAKIADLGVARLMPASRMALLTKGPGNALYMPPEAQGGTYDKSIDVFSFAVLSLLAFTQTLPNPLPVKRIENGKSFSRTEVQRRSQFLEQTRHELGDQGTLVDAIEQCLNDDPKQRPEIQRMLALLKRDSMDTHVQMNKLELLQVLEREQEHAEQRERESQQMIGELVLAIEQKEKECEEVIEQKDMEKQEAMLQLQREKEEAVQQKEGQIVDELMSILGENKTATDNSTGNDEANKSETEIPTPKETRAVMIIGSTLPPPSPPQPHTGILSAFFKKDVVIPEVGIPQSPADLSDEDHQVLEGLGLPPDQWDNLNALLALYKKAENYDVFSVQVSKPGMELSRSYILEQIEFLLKNSKNKTGGAVLHYYGNGRRGTGDWCFRDGFITFRDITDLYMKHSRGRVLTIVPDCHSTGHWVSECARFLDEQGVKPCGHSAKEKGILLKAYTACRTGQDTAELCYTTRAMLLEDDGYVHHRIDKEFSAQQNTFGVAFTGIRCGEEEGEECSMAPEATWSTAWNVIYPRVSKVRGKYRGRPAWHCVLLADDAEKIKSFHEAVASGNVEAAKYGTILQSGWGDDPPEDIVEQIIKKHRYSCTK